MTNCPVSSLKNPLTSTMSLLSSDDSQHLSFPCSLPYLLVSFLPLFCKIDCAPLLSADAAVIEKHTLLQLCFLPPSLTLIGCPLEVTSPLFLCLPLLLAPLFPPSPSPHLSLLAFWPLLYCAFSFFSFSCTHGGLSRPAAPFFHSHSHSCSVLHNNVKPACCPLPLSNSSLLFCHSILGVN